MYLRNVWTYYNETHRSYSLPGPHDTDDIFKVMSSKVKVTDNILSALSVGGILAYCLTVCH